VFANTSEAVDYVFNRLPYTADDVRAVDLDAFAGAFADALTAVNVGLESFYESLLGQGATAVQVDWRPPAGGNEKLMAILAKMKG
jgi:FdrA protein